MYDLSVVLHKLNRIILNFFHLLMFDERKKNISEQTKHFASNAYVIRFDHQQPTTDQRSHKGLFISCADC